MMHLSEKQLRSQKSRSKAIAWALIGFVALVFFVTLVQLNSNMANSIF